jgi:hypothetical protein
MNINIVIANLKDDRVLPRFARHLVNDLGWTASSKPDPRAEANYYFAYFEYNRAHCTGPAAAFFTHRETIEGAKTAAYDATAKAVGLRVVMNAGQARALNTLGKTVQIPLPLDLLHFPLASRPHHARPLLGVAGYTYKSGRKGEDVFNNARKLVGGAVDWTATGRGWPIPCKIRPWGEVPKFFQLLDLYVCTATIEGGPMTTLEALASGCPVVIPDSVGIHPELPDVPGIWRYRTGDADDLARAIRDALPQLAAVDPVRLHDATAPHCVGAWVDGHRSAFNAWLYEHPQQPAIDWRGRAGIYVVAFGDPAREQARLCVGSARAQMPDVPVALCSDKPLNAGETHFIQQPDADIGGRIAKLKAYDLTPPEWDCVLYVDADTEFVAPVTEFFDLTADGWEFVICKDAHLHDTVKDYERRNNAPDLAATVASVGSREMLQINGGVWAFRRCAASRDFFKRWFDEWSVYKGRDQGALLRALYADPLRVFWLGNEWNTMITLKGEEYPPGRKGTAGILHHVGTARRWEGQVPAGKGLTDPEAWAMVDAYKAKVAARKAKGKK